MAFDPTPAARLLARAYNTGAQITEIQEAQRPKSLTDGYAVQDLLATGELGSDGLKDKTAGWKLGLGSANAMKGAGLSRPMMGRVFASRLYRPGDAVPAPGNAQVLVEIEIAFKLARDVGPADSLANPLDAVGEAVIASELVLSRFVDRRAAGLPSFAADSVGFHALVVGQKVDPKSIPALIRSAKVLVDGKETSTGVSGDDAIDPVAMLGHLMAHARERGLTLKKGEIVTTGTITRPFETKVPAHIEARADGAAIAFTLKAV